MVKYSDLEIGEIYLSIMPNNPEWESLFLCYTKNDIFKLKGRLYISDLHKRNRFSNLIFGISNNDLYKKATNKEKIWFNTCLKKINLYHLIKYMKLKFMNFGK